MSDANEQKQQQKPIERVTITDELKPKLLQLYEQANKELNGVASVTKSDVVNLILTQHADTLSVEELGALRAEHFDEIKFTQWMAQRLKEARESGEVLSLQDLLAQSESMLTTRSPRTQKRARRKKKELAADDPSKAGEHTGDMA